MHIKWHTSKILRSPKMCENWWFYHMDEELRNHTPGKISEKICKSKLHTTPVTRNIHVSKHQNIRSQRFKISVKQHSCEKLEKFHWLMIWLFILTLTCVKLYSGNTCEKRFKCIKTVKHSHKISKTHYCQSNELNTYMTHRGEKP